MQSRDLASPGARRGWKAMTLLSRSLLLTAIVSIGYLATTSRHIPVVEDVNDKINHCAAFFTLALLLDFSFPATRYGLSKALPLLGYGLSIEVVQYFLPYRSCSFFDLSADAAGLFLYWIMIPVFKRLPFLQERWNVNKD